MTYRIFDLCNIFNRFFKKNKPNYKCAYFQHNHKKRKDSLETWTWLLRLFVNSHLSSYVINVKVFSLFCQDKNMPGSNFVKNAATPQRNKLALYQTQNGGANQYIIKFFFTILLGPFCKIRAFKFCSCVVHWLCGFSTEQLKISRDFNLLFRKHHEHRLAALLYLLDDRPPSMFHYIQVYIFFNIQG